MSFDKGSVSFRLFLLDEEPAIETMVEKLSAAALPPLNTIAQEKVIGWVGHRHAIDADICEETIRKGGEYRFGLTTAVKQIPTSLLNVECAMEEMAYMEAEGVEFVNLTARREIKENVRERLLPEMPPALKTIDVATVGHLLFTTAVSASQTEALQLNWLSTFGRGIELMDPFGMALRGFGVDVRGFRPVSFSPEVEAGMVDGNAGREFLMWLWWMAEMNLGGTDIDEVGTVAMNLEGPLKFVNEGGGAHETVVKKGNPIGSAETKAALLHGKMLKSAKINMAMGDQVWSFGFDADTFAFSGMKLPPTESYDANSRFAERMQHLGTFSRIFFGLFNQYLDVRTHGPAWAAVVTEMKHWVAERPAAKN